MPDITMCRGQTNDWTCPLRENCYRHTASQSQFLQSYFANPPADRSTGECGYFMRVRITRGADGLR